MGQLISAELLDALDVQPLVGRPFRPDENEGGRDQVMLLSHALWQRRYGGDPGIVGQTITANGKPYTVVGVMPAAFEFPQKRYELWVPFAFRNNAQGMVNRGTHFLQVVGRLRGDTSLEQAQAELTTIARRLEQAYPEVNAGFDDAPGVAPRRDRGKRAHRAAARPQRRRVRSADRVRQCDQPAPRPRVDAPARDCSPHDARREPRPSGGATPHRDARALRRRRLCGHCPRRVGTRCAHRAQPRRHPSPGSDDARSDDARIHARYHAGERHRLRPGARAVLHVPRAGRTAQGGRRDRRQPAAQPGAPARRSWSRKSRCR